MIVSIAGCGALGSLLAARLIEGGVQVQAFQRKGTHLKGGRSQIIQYFVPREVRMSLTRLADFSGMSPYEGTYRTFGADL